MKKQDKVLITGIAGFAGSHLAELLLSHDFHVYGMVAPKEKTPNIRHIKKELTLRHIDLLNFKKTAEYIAEVKPDQIYHLAAFASVGQSFRFERMTYDVNFTGTLNLLNAMVEAGITGSRLLFVSSGDIYGTFKPKTRTLTEEDIPNPISPYGVSKAAAEKLINFYSYHHGIEAILIRAFNHTGPRQSDSYVIPSFCKQIAKIESGRGRGVIRVGNLTPKRDFSDVRDIVRGYYLAMNRGRPGEIYQLCSGRAAAIRTILDRLIGFSEAKIKVEVDKKRFRKSDIPVLRGSNHKAVKELGWECRYKLNETLKDTIDYYRLGI